MEKAIPEPDSGGDRGSGDSGGKASTVTAGQRPQGTRAGWKRSRGASEQSAQDTFAVWRPAKSFRWGRSQTGSEGPGLHQGCQPLCRNVTQSHCVHTVEATHGSAGSTRHAHRLPIYRSPPPPPPPPPRDTRDCLVRGERTVKAWLAGTGLIWLPVEGV